MEQKPILHVWINHNTDLVDLTLTTTTAAQHGKTATKTSETIHTNQKHPFLTLEKGFLAVGQLRLGMHVLRTDGTYGVVTGWKVVPGTQVMYNLEVAQDHTFAVGDGQWVVHNCPNPDEPPPSFRTKVLPSDAYRSGPPDLDLTLGKPDVDSRTGNVKMGLSNGLSHFDRIVSYFEGKTVYKLSAGTDAPDGLIWAYKWNSTVGAYHIGLQPEPGTTMSQDVYESIAEILRASYKEKS